MKNWNLVFRRIHLYLGMLMLPWLAMYALSTAFFNHGEYFRQFRPTEPAWVAAWEKDYRIDVPAGNEALREIGGRVLADQGMKGAFVVQRQGEQLNITLPSFRQPTRLVYRIAEKKLRMEKRKTSWVETFIRLHQRVGYGQPFFLNQLWAVIVDVFCVGTIVWVATGLYLWWKLTGTRAWGFVAIFAGLATLGVLLISL